MQLVTSAEMRALEAAAVAAGASWAGLMEQAGWGVAQLILHANGGIAGRRALVLVGPGNNGGDGLVVARHLHDAGAQVQLYLWRRRMTADDANWRRCRERQIPELDAAADPSAAQLLQQLLGADIVVDGLLGAGASRPVEPDLALMIEHVNAARTANSNQQLYAIDLPTGVHADSGALLGSAIRADCTVATGLIKRGLLFAPGCTFVGRLELASFDIPARSLEAMMTNTLDHNAVQALLPARPADGHKGSFGKVLIMAGSLHYPGAAALACGGAARVGAGLVTLATGRTALGVAARQPEVTLLPLSEGDWGALGPNAVEDLSRNLEGYTAIVIGPGLGQADSTKELLRRMFGLDQPRSRARVGFAGSGEPAPAPAATALSLPACVLDADGLNLLAAIENWPERLAKGGFVFTPHPGEMQRLLGVEELPADSVAVATDAAQQWGQVVVLKSATTVVAAPDGRALVYAGRNPALATAGTGDVLAGVIGGLLAQGCTPFDAAALGVYLHGAAGERVRADLGDAGALASDLLPELPRAIKALR
jgi:ADP-dependent NAD(P)H-hydrate dehydratase / NAD(P)H-hydrate epimerase